MGLFVEQEKLLFYRERLRRCDPPRSSKKKKKKKKDRFTQTKPENRYKSSPTRSKVRERKESSGGLTRSSAEGSVMELERRGQLVWSIFFSHPQMETLAGKMKRQNDKSQPISLGMVYKAWDAVRSNRGGSGVDGKSISAYEANLSKELYKIWNRMASGSYFPPAVKEQRLAKSGGGYRLLGIPTVGDRIAQSVVKQYLEPRLEAIFHPDSYGYRPGRSAHDAISKTRERCWQYAWVIDLDIKGFFDHLDFDLLNKALDKHVPEKWCRMYIDRWLRCQVKGADGTLVQRTRGTPQGGVISPLLANLFLHYAFDAWMSTYYPNVCFERYADDIIVHCRTQEEAEQLLEAIDQRMASCKLQLHPEKTQIVYCPQNGRRSSYERRSFTFLGYDFKARKVRNAAGQWFTGFNPAVGRKASKKLLQSFSQMGFQRWTQWTLYQIGHLINPKVRGWMAYFERFSPQEMRRVFRILNYRLIKWVMNKYKRFKSYTKAKAWLKRYARNYPSCFVHWKAGWLP